MTHEWEDFLVLEEGKDPLKTPKIEPERGFVLSGTIKDVTGEAQEGAIVFLNYKGSNEIGLEEAKTDSLGRFAFRDLHFMDSTLVSLVASKPFPKGKDKQKAAKEIGVELEIALDSIANWVFQNQIEPSKDIGFSMVPLAKLNQDNSKRFYPNEDEQSSLVVLDEVAVSSAKLEKETRYQKRRMLYKNPSQTLDFENVPTLPYSNALEALVGRVPGLSIRNGRIFMRGASSFRIEESAALVLLNGMPMGSFVGVEQIPVSEIDFIDVLKGPKAAIYGSRGANGVVAVYTKIGPTTTKNAKKDFPMGSLSFVHPGFNASREFVGEMPKTENEAYTLFWDPSLFLETNGTSIELDAPKVPGTYKITVEGMCFDGRPLSQVQYFEVR